MTNAFLYTGGEVQNKTIKRAIIDPSIKMVASKAFFGCEELLSVEFHDSIREIGDKAFCGCLSLQEIELPQSSLIIYWDAFRCCSSLKTVVIPHSVARIDYGAFEGCSSLETIYMEESSFIRIEHNSFRRCTSLSTIELPKMSMAHCMAFAECTLLEKLCSSAGHSGIVDWLKTRFDDLPLHRLCYQADIESLPVEIDKCIQENSSNMINETDEAGLTALHLLALNKKAKSREGFCALFRSASAASIPLIEMITAKDVHSQTPIHYACQQDDIIKTLILSLQDAAEKSHSKLHSLCPSVIPQLKLETVFYLLKQDTDWSTN